MAHPLQQLYDACNETFAAAPPNGPSSEGLQHVKSIMDSMTLSDLGLNEETLAKEDRGFGFFGMLRGWRNMHSSMVARWAPPISYRHIHACESFSMGIFFLPTSAVIPLHNHPGMTVLSKLLYGSMHMKSYDWVDPLVKWPETGVPKARLAKLAVDQLFVAPCESSILYPTSGGNIHAIKGVTPCAMLDVLAPPYSEEEGRNVTYYRDSPYASHSGVLAKSMITDVNRQCLAWLEEVQQPVNIVKWVPYDAPEIVR